MNPPGRQTYLRDYFCSKVSQADYINHPIDFVFLSAHLKSAYQLNLVDSIAEELNPANCLEHIRRFNPKTIVGLIGSASLEEDRAFYHKLSQEVPARLILLGDVLIEEREKRLRGMPFVDSFLHDFSTSDLRTYLDGDSALIDSLKNMTIRCGEDIQALPIQPKSGETLDFPTPEHRLFLDKNYRYPFVRSRKFATVMTDFGCPYSCTFCVMSTLGWSQRPVERVLEELGELHSLGVQELLFLDQTFGIPRQRAIQLLESLRVSPFTFGWVCFSRPDVLDDLLVQEMKKAGCHTVILGLETGNEQILKNVQKGYGRDEIRAGFDLCRRAGLRTVATVLLGLPEETEETFDETMAFLKSVAPDFASFNVAVPRMGTPFRKRALDLGLITHDLESMDQSGTQISMPTLSLERERVAAMRKEAVREFYFSTDALVRRLRRSLSQDLSLPVMGSQLRQGFKLLARLVGQ